MKESRVPVRFPTCGLSFGRAVLRLLRPCHSSIHCDRLSAVCFGVDGRPLKRIVDPDYIINSSSAQSGAVPGLRNYNWLATDICSVRALAVTRRATATSTGIGMSFETINRRIPLAADCSHRRSCLTDRPGQPETTADDAFPGFPSHHSCNTTYHHPPCPQSTRTSRNAHRRPPNPSGSRNSCRARPPRTQTARSRRRCRRCPSSSVRSRECCSCATSRMLRACSRPTSLPVRSCTCPRSRSAASARADLDGSPRTRIRTSSRTSSAPSSAWSSARPANA